MITHESRVTTAGHLVVESFDDALLVWDDRTGRLHHLDQLAALVWDELDGHRSVSAVATDLQDLFPDAGAQLRDDVLALVHQLAAEGLVA